VSRVHEDQKNNADHQLSVATDFTQDKWLNRLVFASRSVFLLGVILIIIGGCLEGQVQDPGLSHTGSNFSKASYIVAICTVLCMVLFRVVFLIKARHLSHSSNKVRDVELLCVL
jgi:hypothetical protein